MVYEQWRKSKRQTLLDKHQRWRLIAKKFELSKRAQIRLSWIIYYETKGSYNAAKTCRYFGIGRSTFYKWKDRFDETNFRSLESRSRKPKHVRKRQAEPYKDQRVIRLRKRHPDWGKMKLQQLYVTLHNEEITSWYIQRVIEVYNLYKSPNHKTKRHKKGQAKKKITELKKKVREGRLEPGKLVHLDTIVLYRGGLKRYILTAIDSETRIAYARMYKNKSSSSARDFLLRLHFVLDKKIKHVHSDNGSEFHKHFEKAVKDLNLIHWWSRPNTPKDNAKNERFNRTLKYEFLRHGNYRPDPDIFNQILTDWLIEYNYIRPHQALGYLTPLEIAEKNAKVSTMYSSSTST